MFENEQLFIDTFMSDTFMKGKLIFLNLQLKHRATQNFEQLFDSSFRI